jgi:GGDEF domain-containing protein
MLAIGVGGAAILATVVLSLQPTPDYIEIAAQCLLLGVLIGAVHWGRRGGAIAALVASVAYILLRVPVVIQTGNSSDILQLLLIRIATYGLVGILGGELCGRIKYFFANLNSDSSIDETSRVYNQRFISRLLRGNLSSYQRYGTPFSVVLIELAPSLTADLRASKSAQLVRAVANHVRNDVRLVDDVGRLEDGRFVLLLPQTPRAGAEVAAARVRVGVRDAIGAKDESVTATAICAIEDFDAIQELVALTLPASDESERSAEA